MLLINSTVCLFLQIFYIISQVLADGLFGIDQALPVLPALPCLPIY